VEQIVSTSTKALFKILAAVDKSSYASVVMETVSRLSSYVESDITVFSAVTPKRYRTTESGGEDEETMKKLHERLIRKYFPSNHLAVEAKSDRGPSLFSTQGATVRSKVVEGDPANSICSYAERMSADIVVVGKRGGRNVGALLLGSVSEKVVHECCCSVLVAKSAGLDAERRTSSSEELQGHANTVTHYG
jgi:nucleotide-binding universal stress UspA family protein